MSVEDALAELERRKLYVSWLCQGVDGNWHCTVRNSGDLPFVLSRSRTEYVRRGKGKTLAEAVIATLPTDGFEDLI